MRNKPCLVIPVIHHRDSETTIQEAHKAFEHGADGVFLINHYGHDEDLYVPAGAISGRYGDKLVGLNLLRTRNADAMDAAIDLGLNMLWLDAPGVTSAGISDEAKALAMAAVVPRRKIEIFGSVAFKYQPEEPRPDIAAVNAHQIGMIPTTSGAATGQPPPLEKIRSMRVALGSHAPLAIASGMTPENVGQYAPFLSHILVSTGISLDEHHLDVEKLDRFVTAVRRASST